MSSMKVLTRAMTAGETTSLTSAFVTRFDATVITCHRMGVSRSDGARTGASDPNRRWATIICGRPARHEWRIADA